ncbi:putative aldouronate transport system substrate-binding protein [Anaerocolumna jejuensis DSM 15929]|uniref:Putative aldouronate transport system substrate-binding protein n=1 Tax=Anaerocolumna jejuensis DSM 15929 TaxID=1121322 RepID=A0A1M6P4C6_9FIRM|nr:ABC transporter substrate-binding protein [Anaerocolumna jejuensis]SHK02746.1 putative aldouronate transport system substrate-binding protein [Anaerocolumna jejuensis DSM 15929]
MKKILVVLLAIVMSFSLIGCASKKVSDEKEPTTTGSKDNEKEKADKLVVALRTFGTTPADLKDVQEKINEITREKINAEVELMIIPSGSYKQQMTLMLSGSEQLDVMGANASIIPSAYAGEQIRPLQDLLDKYGQGIKETLGENLLKCGEFAGELYTIPIKCDSASGMGGFILRKDICDKYNIDASTIDSYDKLTKVFETVHKSEPDMTILSTSSVGYSFLQSNSRWDKLGDNFGVLADSGQNLKVVDLFETEEYKEYLKVVREWYEKGYISKDITNVTEGGAALMKAGNLFAYNTAGKPGIKIQEKNSSGYDVEYCQVLPTLTVTGNIWQWTIPQNSKYPEKAMQFINLMYTDKDIINLMAYGIKDKHYVLNNDGTIDYPSGVDASNSGYNMSSMVWSLGNEFNAYVWKGNDPDVWKQTEEWNKTGVFSKAYGFVFNNNTVANEIAAVQNVYDQYRMSLECGVIAPDSALEEMNKKLYDVGLQKIIDEKQKQLDKWAADNNVK